MAYYLSPRRVCANIRLWRVRYLVPTQHLSQDSPCIMGGQVLFYLVPILSGHGLAAYDLTELSVFAGGGYPHFPACAISLKRN